MLKPVEEKPRKLSKTQQLGEEVNRLRKECVARGDRIHELEVQAADELVQIRKALKGLRTKGKLILLTQGTLAILPLDELKRPLINIMTPGTDLTISPTSYGAYAQTSDDIELRAAVAIIARLSQ